MFNNKKGSQSIPESIQSGKADTTIIGSSSLFEGKLKSIGIIRVDGSFSGELSVEGSVIVGDGGLIKGNVKADKITIAGKVEGNIYCSGTLELTPNGKLYGDIEVKSISIEDGAVFQGKCTMIDSSPALEGGTEANIKLLVDNPESISE